MTSTEIANASKIMLGSTEAVKMYIGSNKMWEQQTISRLPQGYTELEYIESTATGGQYIDTGLQMWATMPVSYEIDMKVYMMGKGKDNSTQPTLFGNNYEVKPWPGFVIRNNNNSSLQQDQFPGTTYGSNNTEVVINQVQSNLSLTAHTVTATLFCGKNGSGTPFRFAKCRIYYCKLKANSDTWQRDFVPCLNDENVAGLYDLVENTFYTSPNGVAFVAGPEV